MKIFLTTLIYENSELIYSAVESKIIEFFRIL